MRGNGAVLQQVASGEKMVGVLVDFMALNARAKGSPVEFVIPQGYKIKNLEDINISKVVSENGALAVHLATTGTRYPE